MRVIVSALFIVFAQWVVAQLSILPLAANQEKSPKAKTAHARINKNTLPFWDDFSVTPDGAPDAIRIWDRDTTRQWNLTATRGVFVNSTLAINPPSYKVITFDGLDVNGEFYGAESGLTDELVSDTLDLSAYQEDDEVYLSFYWQAGGNVEPPDQGDSLTLQFYNPADGWRTVWSVDGVNVPSNAVFYQDTVRFTEAYLTDGTMFGFRAYGDQDGPFDAWHLDWIYLNANRGADDFFYEDNSINSEPSVLFSPFKAIPVNQIDIASFSTQVRTTAMNLADEPEGFGLVRDYSLEVLDTELVNKLIEETANIEENDLDLFLNVDPFIVDGEGVIDFGNLSLSSLTRRDSINLEFTLFVDSLSPEFLDNTQINLLVNDTTRTQVLLQDFYAYDDGTAEFAVGTNLVGGQVGVQYWVNMPDTLTHLDIYFPNIAPSTSQNILTFSIFNALDDANPLRTQVVSNDTLNQFNRYALDRPVVVSDTFFITYEQDINEYIAIGLDRSNVAASRYIFENREGQWIRNDRIQGAIMIRPVFQSGAELTLQEERYRNELTIYPNPTSGDLKVSGDYQKIEVRNLLGQLLMTEEKRAIHDMQSLDPGLYLLRVFTDDSEVVVRKILKQ